jgi:NADH dehydrogenase
MERSNPEGRPRVVIVGAGFGGLRTAKELAAEPVEIVLIDSNNYHRFQPLLYQVATAGLEPDEIVHPVRNIFRKQKNVRFLLGTVSAFDGDRRRLILKDGKEVAYDYLVLAAGAATNYFGIPGAAEHGFPMQGIPEALKLRNHILRQFERVERDVLELDKGALNFVIVGGGATGIEMAGQLAELFRCVLKEDYRNVDTSAARVILLEMLPELLMPYDGALRAYARRALEKRGVEVRTETTVERVEPDAVHLEGGERLSTRTLIWAAGIRANTLAACIGSEQRKDGRLVVGKDLSLPARQEVFVIGDMSGAESDEGEPYPQLATVAIQQGRHAARQVARLIQGSDTEAFAYKDPGIMATIGRNAAVAQLPGGIRLKGSVAWLMWAFVHIYKLVGFRNRIDVFLNWVYNYATFNFSARIILDGVPAVSDDEDGDPGSDGRPRSHGAEAVGSE